jgi:PelA/Pel-15E family pectate lyase
MRLTVLLTQVCFLCLFVAQAQAYASRSIVVAADGSGDFKSVQQALNHPQIGTIAWKDAHDKADEWYASAEALRIANNVVLYQRSSGGWPKNINMGKPLSKRDRALILGQQNDNDATIDNGATHTQLAFLARVYTAQRIEQHRESFIKGLDYLLSAQYPNGGWPQFYPNPTGYHKHITYNDNAMIGVMKLLRDVAARKPAYTFVDDARRLHASAAVEKGIECILKTQVVVGGRRTVWCAQHDEVTFAPAAARKFELTSLSGGESVDIVRFLMSIKDPSPAVIEAVESAVKWFEQSELKGIKWVKKADASQPNGFDCVVVKDPDSSVWARFYEIGSNRPIFAGRDAVLKYDVAEIEHERRTNYEWYVDAPAKLLRTEYPAWRKRTAK